ncbi:tetratricopeptide repeat protein [Flavobacterium sp. SM2513]|uniref:hybrid sensor histidine kinase/response regulator transcription factor n=1 Tax=Flavobacterium sp. SM2513 TaxID=3424766 RepID=UPI003D7FFE8D
MFTQQTNPLFFFIFFFNLALFAQSNQQLPQKKIDSLTTVISKQSTSDTLTVNQMNELSRLLAQDRQLELALNNAQKEISISKKLNFKNGEANAYNVIGIINVYKGDYTEALNNLKIGLKKWEETGYKKGVTISYVHIGNVYESQGKYPEALKNFFAALKIYEELDSKVGMAMSYNSIGIVYKNQIKYPQALKNYFAALKIWKEIGDERGIAQSYNNIGVVYDYQGKYTEALKNFFASLKIKEAFGDKRGIAGTYNNIGSVYRSQDKQLEALKNFSASLKILEEIGDKWGIAQSHNNIGTIQLKLNQATSADEHFEKALVLAKKTGAKELIGDVYYNFSLADSALGNYKKAYQNYKQHIIYRDSLINQENEKKSLEISMNYEYEKKTAVTKAELKTKSFQRNVAFAGLGLMIVITVFIIYFFRLRSKKLKVEKENLELQRREVETIRQTEEFKSRFLTNISHEFRTPLTLINGHLEVLKENGRKEDLLHIDEMEQNGKRLLTLINQLLDLSKMESGQYKLKYKKGNVLNEASMLVQSFHSYAEQHKVSLQLQQTEFAKISLSEIAFIYSSEALTVIITNLISNAIKYTPSEGIVDVVIDYQDNKLFVTIADSGRGIALEHLSKIFNRFYQVDEPGQRTFTGSGIGLALVKELAILHGGNIKVESPENGGCVFTFWIESSKAEYVDNTSSEEKNRVLALGEKNKVKNSKIQDNELPLVLVVEDQPELRSFIVQNLGNEYRYAEASNGKDGLSLAEELVPDMIISDVMMPDVDGIELCKILKNNRATSHIPIILLTAKAEQKDKIIGLETGADAYLTKPFSLAELKLRVRNILNFKELHRKRFEGNVIPSPEEMPELNSRDRKFVDELTKTVEDNLSNAQFGITILAEAVFLSVSQLSRKLKSITGKTPAEFIRNIRLQQAFEMLKDGSNVADVSWAIGFEDSVYFSKVFKKHFGFPPSSAKNK